MTEGNAATAVVTAPTGCTDPSSSFNAWLLQKLRLEWSSSDLGGLLTPSKLAEARASFSHLETPIKVRLLLSLLSVRRDGVDEAEGTKQKEINALLLTAEQDAEEWVKISAGIVKQFLILQATGRPTDSYLHAQLETTASKVVKAVTTPPQTRPSSNAMNVALADCFSLENGLLNPLLRPPLAPTVTTHFTVSGEDDDANGKEDEVRASPVKKPLHRPQMARMLGSSGVMATSTAGTTSSLARTQVTAKTPVGKRKNMTELSSEIRRKADAGRFKRQRNRISMIDINEVKQIESEKAQKAEERKKQKLAAKEKEREKAKEKEKEKSDALIAGATVDVSEKGGVAEATTVPAYVNNEHAAIAADIFAMHHQQHALDDSVQQYSQPQLQTESNVAHAQVTSVAAGGDDYVPDGTQALLNAAFHSTQDIMKEVVSQQNQQMQEQHQMQHQQLQAPAYQDLYRTQQQMQMQPLAPPQQQYHQGFEPEDASIVNANTGAMPMGFGGYNYGTTAGYYYDQFGNYGAPQDTNAFGSTGYPNSAIGHNGMNGIGLPPLGGRQLGFDPTQQQPQHQHQHQQQNNGGYMGGSGEYWR
uniref:NELF-A N-terminal domain-containing protein n=1 Tax=Peronospora matthiolae TaxID=2874970 RepID=A0AAV1TMJ6_9STRA